MSRMGYVPENEINKFLQEHMEEAERASDDLCENIPDMVYLAIKYKEEGGSDIGVDDLFTAYAGNMYGFTKLATSKYHIFYVNQLIDTIEKHGMGFLKDIPKAGVATWDRIVFGLHSLTGEWYSKDVTSVLDSVMVYKKHLARSKPIKE